MKTIGLIISSALMLLASCSQVSEPEDHVFTVNNPYNLGQDSIERGLLNEIPAPKATFYLYHHFIADSAGQLFYYQLPQKSTGCGQDYDYRVPEYIGLRPHHLVQVPQNSVGAFTQLNILSQNAQLKLITIGLLKDTVTSSGLAQLRQVIQNQSGGVIYLIRRATLEEAVVLGYKKRQEYYHPSLLKWDFSKIKFTKTPKDRAVSEQDEQ